MPNTDAKRDTTSARTPGLRKTRWRKACSSASMA